MEASGIKWTLRVFLCGLIAFALVGYGLDLGCTLNSAGCDTATCCVDCLAPGHPAAKADNSGPSKAGPALLSYHPSEIAADLLLPTGEVSFLPKETQWRSALAHQALPVRGPPALRLI